MLRSLAVAALLAVFLSATGLSAQTRPTTAQPPKLLVPLNSSDVLKGMRGFVVELAIQANQVDTATTRTKLELKLRQNAIRVGDEFMQTLKLVCISLDKRDAVTTAFYCRLQVLEVVTARTWLMFAETYSTGGIIKTAGQSNYKTAFDSTVIELIDDFLNDWYKANPKSP